MEKTLRAIKRIGLKCEFFDIAHMKLKSIRVDSKDVSCDQLQKLINISKRANLRLFLNHGNIYINN